MFKLLEAFETKPHIIDLKLCKILMEDKEYPWILLIPMRNNITQIDQLSEQDSFQLMEEIGLASRVMNNLFSPDRLNIAAIGNKTPQLHIHIIARNENDPLWPETVWGQKMIELSEKEKLARADSIRKAFLKMGL